MGTNYLRPDADDIDGSWLNESSSAVNLYASIDESSPSDADYIQSPTTPVGEVVKIRFSDPAVTIDENLPVKLRYRYWRNTTNSAINLQVRLLEGVTERATWIENAISTAATTTERTLSAGEVASITDWTNLYVEITANPVTDMPGIGSMAIGAHGIGA